MTAALPSRPIPWVPVAFFAALLFALFYDVLADLVLEWRTDDDMSHGFFVPVIAGYVAWQIRDRWLAVELRSNAWGLALVAWGGFQMVAGTLGAEMFIARTALVISLAGMLLYIGGFGLIRTLAFPLFLLLFMIRIPNIIYSQLTLPLQMFASAVAEHALSALGVPVLREGNILHLAHRSLSVVEACSGIRSLLSLAFLAVVYAYLFDDKPWMRAALLVLTVPIAVGANAFRVTATGLISNYKPELAEGFFHSLEGWLVFLVAFVAMTVAHRAVNFVWDRTGTAQA